MCDTQYSLLLKQHKGDDAPKKIVVKYDFLCCLVRAMAVGTVQPIVRSELQTSKIMNIIGIRIAGLQPATRIPLQPSHTETPTHIETRTIRPMW